MRKRKIYGKVGDIINGNWEIIEYGVINPDTKNKAYIGKNVFAKIKCLQCGKTERYCLIYDLKRLAKCCHSCTLINRNIKDRAIQVGDRFGKLVVIDTEGEYRIQKNGKKRHYSLVQCDCGSNPFLAKDNQLLSGNKKSCGCLVSNGEFIIQQWLDNNKITYCKEFSFFDLISPQSQRKLRFDFAVFKENQLQCLIEFDGRQHILGPDTSLWGRSMDTLESIQERDNTKNEYCKKHNIKLIRIPYYKINQIPNILTKELMKEGGLYADKN